MLTRTKLLGILVIAMVVAASLAGSAFAATIWTVDPGGFGDFTTIGSALADGSVLDGDTIDVLPGTYFENLSISKAVTLRSTAGSGVTTINGGGSGPAVSITSGIAAATTPTVEGFTITGGNTSTTGSSEALKAGGVHLEPGSVGIVRNNIISGNLGFDTGAVSVIGAVATIKGNTIDDNHATGAGFGPAGGILRHGFHIPRLSHD